MFYRLPCSERLLLLGTKTEQVSTAGQGSGWAGGTGFHKSWPFKWVQCDTMCGSAVKCWKQAHMFNTPWPPHHKPALSVTACRVVTETAGITTPWGSWIITGPNQANLDLGVVGYYCHLIYKEITQRFTSVITSARRSFSDCLLAGWLKKRVVWICTWPNFNL